MLKVYIVCIYIGLVESANIAGDASGTLNLGVLIPWTNEWTVGGKMGGAIAVAVDKVNTLGFLPHTVDWEWKDTQCETLPGLKAALDIWDESTDLDAFIGGGCSEICKSVALTCAAWDLPIISWGCTDSELSDKYTYPTFTRTVGTWPNLAPMFNAFMNEFGWDRMAVVSTTESIMQLTANAIADELIHKGKSVTHYSFQTTVHDGAIIAARYNTMENLVKEIKEEKKAYIFVLLMYDSDKTNFLLEALDNDMMNGEYVFLGLDTSLDARISTTRADDTLYVYEGLLSVNLEAPSGTDWDNFAQDVIDEFQSSESNTKFSGYDTLAANAAISEVDVHAGMLYDAILAWAYGVNLTIAASLSLDGGYNVSSYIRGLEFDGITGRVIIDSSGDRQANYEIAIADNGTYTKMLHWEAFTSALSVSYTGGSSGNTWAGIVWSGGATSVPLGRPECGWDGEFCEKSNIVLVAVLSSLACILCAAVIVGFFVRRHYKYEKALKDMKNSLAHWEEIKFNRLQNQLNASRANTLATRTCTSLAGGNKIVFSDVASYHGVNVSVKMLKKKFAFDTDDRNFLKELKQMMDMKHENINRFVGLCPHVPNICVLMLHGQKGSLQDLLHNNAVSLSWDFVMSLATDIGKGMQYLHNSIFQTHGRLNSHNCIVDSRWVCKITDYGLHSIRLSAEAENPDPQPEPEYKLSWYAPELLRLEMPPPFGTKAGDVYSYGIILSEIATRGLPYEENLKILNSYGEIISLVRDGTSPPTRPIIPDSCCGSDWLELTSDCWEEEENKRPTFTYIRKTLQIMNGGKAINVIDNMVKMLERQTEHLEELVEEKNILVESEKKKVSMLLYDVLPKSIANDLRKGKVVEPKTYDLATFLHVSITNLAEVVGTYPPMHIVHIINDMTNFFNLVTEMHEVYKVTNTNNSILVVSGVPVPTSRHADVAAGLAVDLLNKVKSHEVVGYADVSLRISMALHSGPCVGAIVGQLVPRYFVFGDAVNLIIGMQNYTEESKILLSSTTTMLLSEAYSCEKGEVIDIPNHGRLVTYWLNET